MFTLSFHDVLLKTFLYIALELETKSLIPSRVSPPPPGDIFSFLIYFTFNKILNAIFSNYFLLNVYSLSPPFSNKKNKTEPVIGQWLHHY